MCNLNTNRATHRLHISIGEPWERAIGYPVMVYTQYSKHQIYVACCRESIQIFPGFDDGFHVLAKFPPLALKLSQWLDLLRPRHFEAAKSGEIAVMQNATADFLASLGLVQDIGDSM